jgi:hypothetical protein
VSCGGVVCLVPGCEVINSEGRTTSVVCSEVILFFFVIQIPYIHTYIHTYSLTHSIQQSPS